MKTLKAAVALCAAVLFASTAFAESDTATRQKLADIESKMQDIKSYKVTMKMEMQMMGQTMTTDGKIAFKKPDKMRMTTTTSMMPGATQEMYSSGDIMWTYMPMMRMATKMDMKKLKAAGQNQSGIGANADITNPFKGIPEDKVNYVEEKDTDEGRAYVFEAYPDLGGKMPPGAPEHQMLPKKMVMWISADTGLPVKIIMIGENGNTMMEQDYSDFQINPEIDDSVFEFTPPEGVQVMDMTEGAMNMMQQMQGSHPK
jgi:outer membrane lipoprotein carrier protein